MDNVKNTEAPERIELPNGWYLTGPKIMGEMFLYDPQNEFQGAIEADASEAFAAAMVKPEVSGWQPIKTAPVASNEPQDDVWVFGGRYRKPQLTQPDGEWWRSGIARNQPTHWMPQTIPAAPQAAQAQTEGK
ncbi:hypothetical protein U8C35_06395 [Sinorhizobium medicae]|uniref:hypothetical protein n=1 Tax=Sinorhizobium medicae TaxID=110321 RepID=UPI002AF6C067|nr:hypothetical protein [Sinorhizobium medicae]WQO60062.1 hypothetical protein U8C35_06395 [Sinorhizobium medicae]